MTLNELIDHLVAMRTQLSYAGVALPGDVEVALWSHEDGGVLETELSVDHDSFEEDGPWFVLIEQPGDPGRG